MRKALTDLNIFITRPLEQAAALENLITEAGATVIQFPVLQILDTENPAGLLSSLQHLEEFDLAIFVSPNAVHKVMQALPPQIEFPPNLRVATIGPSTKRELENYGIKNIIAPTQRFDSEALLDLPEFADCNKKRVVIFRGDGGRDLLGAELTARGAQLQYIECYRRIRPNSDPAILFKYWDNAQLSGIIVTSSEGLRNLFEMIGEQGQRLLKTTAVFVPHERIRKTGYDLGLNKIILTAQGDQGIVTDLIAWFNQTH
jgi:uroporphyrinogen-III synthase